MLKSSSENYHNTKHKLSTTTTHAKAKQNKNIGQSQRTPSISFFQGNQNLAFSQFVCKTGIILLIP